MQDMELKPECASRHLEVCCKALGIVIGRIDDEDVVL
jgi:hypothetical protein